MVAVVSNTGLGLFGGTVGAGNAATGRGTDRAYINTTTGNLIVQSVDESLVARGLDMALVRTYNSQGAFDDDNWRLGVHQSVYGLTGTLNMQGSTVIKVFGDGREVTYQFDPNRSAYVSSEGERSHDTLVNADGVWTWTEGSGGASETYDASGRLAQSADTDGNLVTYQYDGAYLEQITDASGQITHFEYDSNGNLSEISVDSDGDTQTLTRYFYDSLSRLRQVVVDLRPDFDGVPLPVGADGLYYAEEGESYVTTYEYDGNSHRIASMSQTDGSSISFAYELIEGEYRVTSHTDAENRTTTFTYSHAAPVLVLNQGALTAGGTQGTTAEYQLDTSQLTAGSSGGGIENRPLSAQSLIPGTTGSWSAGEGLPASAVSLTKFNASGNGIAILKTETEVDTIVTARFYDAATGTWSSATRLDDANIPDFNSFLDVAFDESGNAVVLLNPQWSNGMPRISANVFNSNTGTWSGPLAVANPPGTDEWPTFAKVEMRNGRAVATWSTDTAGSVTYYAAVYTGTAWSTPFSRAVTYAGQSPVGSIDEAGNAWVAWTEYSSVPDENDLDAGALSNAVRFNASSGNWSSVSTLESGAVTLAFGADSAGRAIRISLNNGLLSAQRFNPSSGTWSAQVSLGQLSTAGNIQTLPELTFDASGNALVVWGRDWFLEVRRFDVASASWLAPESLDVTGYSLDAEAIRAVSASLRGDDAAISWVAAHDEQMRVFAIHRVNGEWTRSFEVGAGNLAIGETRPSGLAVTLETDGEYVVAWQTFEAVDLQVHARRLTTSLSHASYRVPVGASWQSVAQALYGVSTVEAADLLRTALGNPTLAAGSLLTGMPLMLELPATTSHELDADALMWSGTSSSPVVQTYLDEAGRVIGTRHADGTLTTHSRNAAGELVSLRHHVAGSVTPLWSQDFSQNSNGLSSLHAGFMTLENGGVTVISRNDVSYGWRTTVGDRIHDFDDHVVFRAEVTTGSTFEGRGFNIGASNGAGSRYHRAEFNGESLYAGWNGGTASNTRLGSLNNDTTYVVEVVTHAAGSSLYVYEKGTDRLSGYAHHSTSTDWSDARISFETLGHPALPSASVRLDNLSEASVPGALLGGLIAVESSQDDVGYPRGWSNARQLEVAAEAADVPTVVHDESGNALAAWVQGTEVVVRRYDAATGRWNPAVIVDNGASNALWSSIKMDAATGNAVLTWVRSDGVAHSLFASVLNPQTGAWGAAQLLESQSGAVAFSEADPPSVAVNGNRAAIAWLQHNGTANDIVSARFDGTSWSTAVAVDGLPTAAQQPQVVIDSAGNTLLAWRQQEAGGWPRIWINRWNESTQSYSGQTLLDAASEADRLPKLALDAQGNAYALWGMAFRRFDAASATWGPTIDLSAGSPTVKRGWDMAVDAQGNALVSWIEGATEGNVVYARLFDGTSQTWGSRQALENLSNKVDVDASTTRAALRNGHGVVTWLQEHNSSYSVYAAEMTRGVWSVAQLLEGRQETPSDLSPAIDAAGNATILWEQADGAAHSIFEARFSRGLPMTYVVGNGATWRSIANDLYHVDSDAAGEALSDELGDPALAPGLRLEDLPATLLVSGGVGSYYLVPDDPNLSWQLVAATLYGINSPAAGAALEAAMSPVTLTPGMQLTNLPAFLQVEVQAAAPAYYTVRANDDWSAITEALYGTSDPSVVDAFRDAVDPQHTLQLAAGLHITPPRLLTLSGNGSGGLYELTNVESPLGRVTTYLRDVQGRLVSVLSPAVGGARLETRFSYDSDGNVTSISEDPNGANRITAFNYDDNGNLVLSRDATGSTVVREYDDNNQVIAETRYHVADPDGGGAAQAAAPLTTRFVYDEDRHLRFTISPERRVVERRYTGTGELQSSFTYQLEIYDGSEFTLEALSDWVIEENPLAERVDYFYDFRGNLTRTREWTQRPEIYSITQYVYDQRGRLLQTIDARGSLAFPADGENSNLPYSTTYSYDGLGRVLSATQWVSGPGGIGQSRTITEYYDADRQILVEMANGHAIVSTYNAAGELIEVLPDEGAFNGFGATSYVYDEEGRLRMTRDPTGVKHFCFYDAAGRKIAEVDGDGSLVEYVYGRTNQLIKSIQYAGSIDPLSLVDEQDDTPLDRTIEQLRAAAGGASAQDRISRNVYDSAGRLAYSIDARGAVTRQIYDGAGLVTAQLRYHDRVSIDALVGELAVSQLNPGGEYAPDEFTLLDRRTRNFYDGDGLLLATMDGEGSLVEFEYDAAGHLIHQVAYATPVAVEDRGLPTLEEVRPPAEDDPLTWLKDIHTYFHYDKQGRLMGTLDGERYLTETRYDAAGNVTDTFRYGRRADEALEIDPYDFYALSDEVGGFYAYAYGPEGGYGQLVFFPYETRSHRYERDGAGRVISDTDRRVTTIQQGLSQVVVDESTTEYEYDELGQLIRTTRGAGESDARTTRVRYDELGNVIQELSAEGAAQITPELTALQVEQVWDRFGVRYGYDDAGRRVTASVRPNDEQTNVTRFYYDADGRVRFEVNALGERKEYRYNAFGQVEHELAYHERLTDYSDFTAADLALLTGGLLTESSAILLTRGYLTNQFSQTSYTYTAIGLVQSTLTSEGASTTYSHNAFGEVSGSSQAVDAERSLDHSYDYDRRGLLTETHWDPEGLDTSESRGYDAFGRLTTVTDARGNSSHVEYDGLGQQTATVDARGARVRYDNDGFARVREITPLAFAGEDGSGPTTFYHGHRFVQVYGGDERRISLTTENIYGQLSTEVLGETGNLRVYQYDRNGNLRTLTDDAGPIDEHFYDRGGRRTESVDARGTTTWFRYDAANRLIRQIADAAAGGLQLETEYEYDALGRLTTSTEPNGRVTRTEYDADGRVIAITVNPDGEDPLRTEFEYDFAGNLVLKIEDAPVDSPVTRERAPRRTQYEYDVLGRMTRMIVDPAALGGTLNLVTRYFYDDNGNRTREIDAEEHSTWYVYDENNRVVQTIDALGGVTEIAYDAEGHAVERRRYANAVETAGFGNEVARLERGTDIAVDAVRDRVTRSFFDGEGRERYTLDGLGGLTGRGFDALGNVVYEMSFLNRVDMSEPITTLAGLYEAMSDANINSDLSVPNESDDRLRWMAYDNRGRLTHIFDVGGGLTQFTYDNGGNVIETRQFAAEGLQVIDYADLPDLAATHANANADRITRSWYDSLGRVRFTVDAEGYLRETQYDTENRTQSTYIYAQNALTALAPYPAPDLGDLVSVVAAIRDETANSRDQSTITTFDVAGRVARIDFADETFELFTYDGVGNRTSYTNQAGSTWTYVYDANGRLTEEHSPLVATTVIGLTMVNGREALEVDDARDAVIITRMTYDALGNVESRTEGIRYYGGAEDASGSRTTEYEYDELGRQIITRHPAVRVYDTTGNDAANTDAAAMRHETATPERPTTTVYYNTLGDAVTNVDVGGGVTRKAYDRLGRVVFEVDAMGYVTELGYDTFGNKTSITRLAAALPDASANPGAPSEWTAAYIDDEVDRGSADRTITMEYDRLNRETAVFQPSTFVYTTFGAQASQSTESAAAETRVSYDAFGQVTSKRTLLDPEAETYAETRYFYDKNGRQRFELNPLNYLTRVEYDAAGNVVRQVEYARVFTGTSPWNFTAADATTPSSHPGHANGYDRDTEFVYDKMGRLIEQRVHNVEYMDFALSEENPQYGTQTTTFGYDTVGNQNRVTLHNGATTFSYFDALGRLVAMAEPQRLADATGDYVAESIRPYVELRRDVYGNLVQEIRYRQGVTVDSQTGARQTLPTANAAADHVSLMYLDSHGHATRTEDAAGNVRHASYNLRGDLAKEWQHVTNADGHEETLVTIRQYDLLGREVATIEPMRKSDASITTVGGEIISSMRHFQVASEAPLEWVGTNTIRVYWPELNGISVRVQVDYEMLDEDGGGAGTGPDEDGDGDGDGVPGHSIITKDFASTRSGETISWTDPADSNDAGIFDIERVRVYALGPNGPGELLYDSLSQPTSVNVFYRRTVHTQLQYNAFGEVIRKGVNDTSQGPAGNYQETFEYDNAGRVRRTNTGDGVDRLYFYDVAGRTTLEIRRQQVGATDTFAAGQETAVLAQNHHEVMRTETVYNKLDQIVEQRLPLFAPGDGVGEVINSVLPLRIDSERLEQMEDPNVSGLMLYRWDPTSLNDVEFTWADVGNQPVLIVMEYRTLPGSHYGYHSPESTVLSTTFEDANGGTGFRGTWTTPFRADNWVIEQGIALSPAGILPNNQDPFVSIRVYGRGANNEYTQLLRSFGVPVGEPETTGPTVAQTLDRWGNVIAYRDNALQTTHYRYNVFGALVEKIMPEVSVLETRSSEANFLEPDPDTPRQTNYYDILGRSIGSRDANRNLNRVVLDNAGQVTEELHADLGIRRFVYDTFGNQVQVNQLVRQEEDEQQVVTDIWSTTRTIYDAMNRARIVTTDASTENQPAYISREFGYDGAGRRIWETSGALMDDGSTPETTKYFYDLLGNLIERRTPPPAPGHASARTFYAYDLHGRKVFEENGAGDKMTWEYDTFGRLQLHVDMGGAATDYDYNAAGLLISQTNASTGQDIDYEYDEAGNLRIIDDHGVFRETTYEYDAFGRRARERTVVEGVTHQDVQITYDEHGRIRRLEDLRYSVTYHYDAQGNRTFIDADYEDHTGALQSQELWYTYDAMNRVKLSQGVRTGNTLGISEAHGVLLSYTFDGQRASAEQYGQGKLVATQRNGELQPGEVAYTAETEFGHYTESYTYDLAQRLIGVNRTGELRVFTDGSPHPVEDLGPTTVSSRVYDGASRQIFEHWQWGTGQVTRSTYDDSGRITLQTTHAYDDPSAPLKTRTEFFYDGADMLTGYHVKSFQASGEVENDSFYYNWYLKADTYLIQHETANTQSPDDPTFSGAVRQVYNANRELIAAIDNHAHQRNRYFANNANGQAITVIQGDFGDPGTQGGTFSGAMNGASGVRAQHFYSAMGNHVGTVGRLQTDTDLVTRANFDVNYTPLEKLAASTPMQVVVQEGDTLRTIAGRIYGDQAFWYLIADANGEVEADAQLTVGRLITIPNLVVARSNNATSFKPFSVEQVIGELTPTQAAPPPPTKGGCGVMGMILVAVIAIVVTATLGPMIGHALGQAFSGMSAAAYAAAAASSSLSLSATIGTAVGYGLGAAAGSLVSQGVAVAIGIQDKISWKAVAASALTAGLLKGVGGGVEKLLDKIPNEFLRMAAHGAVNGAINQGVNIALGLQDKFSWRELAISATSAAMVGIATKGMDPGPVRNAVNAVTSAGVRLALGGRMEADAILADVFSNVIGNSIADKLQSSGASSSDSELASGSPEPSSGLPSLDELTNIKPTPDEIRAAIREFGGVDQQQEPNSAATPMAEIVVTGYRNRKVNGGSTPNQVFELQGNWRSTKIKSDLRNVRRSAIYRPGSGEEMQALASQRVKGGVEYYFPNETVVINDAGVTTERRPGLHGTALKYEEGILDWLGDRTAYLFENRHDLGAEYVDAELAAIAEFDRAVRDAIGRGDPETADALRATDAPAYLDGSERARARLNSLFSRFDPNFQGLPDTPDQQLMAFALRSGAMTLAMVTGGATYAYLSAQGGWIIPTVASSVVGDATYQFAEMGSYGMMEGRAGQEEFSFLQLAAAPVVGLALGKGFRMLDDQFGVSSIRTRPAGLHPFDYDDVSRLVHARAAELGLGDDIFMHGSRVRGTARLDSDLDFGIRVSPEEFESFLNTRSTLRNPNPGSSLSKTRQWSMENGIIQRGEARLSGLGRQLERQLGMKVDLSVIRAGGNFDKGPYVPLVTRRAGN